MPGGHAAHASKDTAPLSALNVPGGQRMQEDDVCPVAELYVPAAQKLQLADDVPPLLFKKRPAGHGVHAETPGASE